MFVEGDRPQIGGGDCMLGALFGRDVTTDPVVPGNKGMFVAPDLVSLGRIPRLVPARLNTLHPSLRGAIGPDEMQVWCLGSGPFEASAVTDDLELIPDKARHGHVRHGVVAPSRTMSLEAYQAALAATVNEWTICEQV
jgi:hypothetical protein